MTNREEGLDEFEQWLLEIAAEWKDWIPYPDSPQSEWDRFNLASYIAATEKEKS